MIYKKVKRDFCYNRFGKDHYCFKDELFTQREIEKYEIPCSDKFFETVSIPKSKTFFCFGVRKEYSKL